jgi:hypothetical protein
LASSIRAGRVIRYKFHPGATQPKPLFPWWWFPWRWQRLGVAASMAGFGPPATGATRSLHLPGLLVGLSPLRRPAAILLSVRDSMTGWPTRRMWRFSIFGAVLRDAEMPDLGILEPTFCVVIWVRSAKNRRPLRGCLIVLKTRSLVAYPCSDLLSIFNMLRASIRGLYTFHEYREITTTFCSFAAVTSAVLRSAVEARSSTASRFIPGFVS